MTDVIHKTIECSGCKMTWTFQLKKFAGIESAKLRKKCPSCETPNEFTVNVAS